MDVGADAVYHAPTVAGGLSSRGAAQLSAADRAFYLAVRCALLMLVSAIEERLGMERTSKK